MRKLASVQIIAEKKPIEGADKIEAVRVNGWWVVAKKDEFQVGDSCVYFEIDSFIPVRPEFEFLRKSCFKSTPHLGDGFRLRTIKMRGQISQGLALPFEGEEGVDLTDELGVKLWEPEPCRSGGGSGVPYPRRESNFPHFIPKTDQQRVQNIPRQLREASESGEAFEVSIKLDGSSITVYHKDGHVGVCSRNFELKPDDTSNFTKVAIESCLVDWLIGCGQNIALQGELMGPGIQGNREKLTKHEIHIFDIWDINAQRYLLPNERYEVYASVGLYTEVKHVPVIATPRSLPPTVDEILALAEGPSLNPNTEREGLVFKSYSGGRTSFKAISNKYLLDVK